MGAPKLNTLMQMSDTLRLLRMHFSHELEIWIEFIFVLELHMQNHAQMR